jgi:Secretion system C-terminal sorting domain
MLSILKCINKILITGAIILAPVIASAQNWQQVGDGFHINQDMDGVGGIVNSINVGDTLMYLNGTFMFADSILVNGICSFDGLHFDSLGIGFGCLNPTLNGSFDMAYYDDLLWSRDNCNYYGYDGQYRDYVTIWDGNQWYAPFDGYSDQSITMALTGVWAVGDYLYFGTAFGDSLNGFYTDGLLRYDGVNYELLQGLHFDTGDICTIEKIVEFQDKLYIAGNFFFDDVDGNFTQDIAYYDSEGWHRLTQPLLGDPIVMDMVVFQDELYISGQIYVSSGNAAQGIMKWNGSEWSGLGIGSTNPNDWMKQLLVTDSVLWVTGTFQEIGGIAASQLAAWDGEKWCSTGSTIDAFTREMFSFKDTLYISTFSIDGEEVGGLAKWIGGNMLVECGEPINAHETELNSIVLYPNPVSDLLNINTREGHSELKIFDTLGQLLLTKNINTQSSMDASQLKAGIYLLSIESKNGKVVKRFIKE